MKKSTMINIANYIKNVPELSAEYAEMTAELTKNAAKAQANRELYAAAYDTVMKVMSDVPMTIADIYEKCKDSLPEGFTKAKVQYAMLNYWNDKVVKIDNGKRSVMTYRKA